MSQDASPSGVVVLVLVGVFILLLCAVLYSLPLLS